MSELEDFFVFKSEKGLKDRLKKLKYKVDEQAYWDRLNYEIGIIKRTGFVGYFLIVSDFISWSRRNSILVGPGRGSAAGSLVAYALGITNLDPIKNELYFERFLNPERISPPDIDVDFDKERRDQVIEYVKQRYGNDKVAQIGTFGTFKAKAAIKAVARTLGLPLSVAGALSNAYPKPEHGKEIPFSRAVKENVLLAHNYANKNSDEGKILSWVERVEGRVASFGIHASGIVIGNDALHKLLPLARGKENEVVTQWDMNKVEQIGLIKFDFLGLKTLTVIRRAIETIKERHKVDIDIDNLDLEDDDVYQKLREGDTMGVFQLEASDGMQSLLVKIRPTCLDDITALIAMYRPGPLDSPKMQDYLNVRAGVASAKYDHPDLKPILCTTSGWLVYQEQLMAIAKDLGKYTLAEADVLRKVVGKKKKEELEREEPRFKAALKKNGYPESLASSLWNEFLPFADYAFNKSHAAAYALLVYQTAWLKTHYPAEFMAAALTCDIDNTDQVKLYLEECKRLGIKVLPPDINKSQSLFTVVSKDEIRFGLSAIKFLGEEPVRHIIAERGKGNNEYVDVFDFARRVDLGKINRRKLEALALAGAFDGFGLTRSSLLNAIESILEYKEEVKKYSSKDQTYKKKALAFLEREAEILAGAKKKSFKAPEAPDEPEKPRALDLSEMPTAELLRNERELTGFYMSGHPLDAHQKLTERFESTVARLKWEQPEKVELLGVIHSIEERETKAKKMMGIARLEDRTGTIAVTIFPAVWAKLKHIAKNDTVVLMYGSVEYIEAEDALIPTLFAKSIDVLPEAREEVSRPINLVVPLKQHMIEKVKETLDLYKGDSIKVNLSFQSEDGTIVKSDTTYTISNQDTSFKNAVYKIIQQK